MSKWGYALRYQQNDFCGIVYFPLFLHFLWMYSISWNKCLGAYLKFWLKGVGSLMGRRVLDQGGCWLFSCADSAIVEAYKVRNKVAMETSFPFIPTIKKVREIGGWLFNGFICLTLKWALIWERVLIRAWELNPLTPKISLVILLTVCHAILMMSIWRIWYWINS